MTGQAQAAVDVVLVGGGLANGLIAYRLRMLRPDIRVLVLEAGAAFGGNHTWSFHATDLDAAQRAWTSPFVAHSWPFYSVAFPGFHRRVDLGYCSATSDRLHAVLSEAGIPVRFGCVVESVEPRRVQLEDGTVIDAQVVIDGRGAEPAPHLRLGWQKFVGLEVSIAEPHRLMGPILMDATVEQIDGYRFVYVLPFGPNRLLVEDTYYSGDPQLDAAALRDRVLAYAFDKGWTVTKVEREETGVLPITLAGEIDTFWAGKRGQACAGLRAGLFHPTTGYSWPEAVYMADRIATLPSLEAKPLADAIETYARERWRHQRMFRALNRMMFLAGDAAARWAVMRRFYRFPEAMIARFYASDLSLGDKIRLVTGKPPVPIGGALRALADSRVPAAGRPALRQ